MRLILHFVYLGFAWLCHAILILFLLMLPYFMLWPSVDPEPIAPRILLAIIGLAVACYCAFEMRPRITLFPKTSTVSS